MLSFPNAKINIGLYITEKRQDGYHNLETLFFPVPLCDILEIVPVDNSDDTLNLTGIPVPGDSKSNLVLKALELLRKDYEFPSVKINLHKIIPMGAGLGGGSADAAFTLMSLNKQFDLGVSEEKLMDYALQLGSDCPFFIKNKAQFATGRGELMSDVDLSLDGMYMLLVFPGIHIGTKEAFQGISPAQANYDLRNIASLSFSDWQSHLSNDFEKNAFAVHPLLSDIHLKLREMGAIYCQMTGSGSCIYGIFSSEPEIQSEFQSMDFRLIKISG